MPRPPAKRPETVRQLPKGVYWKRDSLWVFVGRDGKKFHRPAHTTSTQVALQVRDGLLKEVLAGEKPAAGVGNVTCGQLLATYLERLKRTSREDTRTYEGTKGTVERNLLPYFGKMRASKVSRPTLERYRDIRIKALRSQVTVNRELGYLRAAYYQGRKDRVVNDIPDFTTAIIARAERENARTGIVTEEQYNQLVPLLDVHVRALFVLAWNTGVRPAEAFRLQWSQVDWHKRLIAVLSKQAKIGVQRYLPMRQRVYDEMRAWQAYLLDVQPKAKFIFTHPATGQRMTNASYRGSWETACLTAGYAQTVGAQGKTYKGKTYTRQKIKTDLLFYDARRAFRTYMPEEITTVDGKSVMGHTTDTMYGRYHVEPQRAAQRVLKALEAQQPTVEQPASPPAALDATARLQQLKQWSDAGLIDEEEYRDQKRALLASLSR